MADDYRELFLKLTPNAVAHVVREWMERHGLSVTTMQSGLLLAGSQAQIEQAFAVSFEDLEPPASLPVPAELADHVASVTLPRPRSYHL